MGIKCKYYRSSKIEQYTPECMGFDESVHPDDIEGPFCQFCGRKIKLKDNEDYCGEEELHTMLTAAPAPSHTGDASEMLKDFIADQEPLGAEFEAVYEENKEALYEFDDDHIADAGKMVPVDDSDTAYRIGDLGNQLHNLGCWQQNNEELADRLAELAHQAWMLQRDLMRERKYALSATPSVPEEKTVIADDLELWLSQVRRMEGLSAIDIIESAEDYIALLRNTAGDAGKVVPKKDARPGLCDWLYRAGYVTREKERDYDPRGHEAWQACYDAMTAAPSVPEEEIKARALEEFADDMESESESALTDAYAQTAAWAETYARAKARRLRTAGDDGEGV